MTNANSAFREDTSTVSAKAPYPLPQSPAQAPTQAPTPGVLAGPPEAVGAVLREACSLPAAPNPIFDRFAHLVRTQLGVPVSLVALVSRDEQVLPGALGLPEPFQQQRRTPLTHSVCQHVVLTRRTLLLTDIRALPWLAENLAIPDLGVVAYAGAPLIDAAGDVVGSLCAIDQKPRTWTSSDRQVLEHLAAACSHTLAQLAAAQG